MTALDLTVVNVAIPTQRAITDRIPDLQGGIAGLAGLSEQRRAAVTLSA